MAAAREALRGAHLTLPEAPARAVSSAYYAMLYAARAALSEADRHARTHRGTWQLFREEFVLDERFDAALLEAAHAAQELREEGDYAAKAPSREEAAQAVEHAERFLGEVAGMLGDR